MNIVVCIKQVPEISSVRMNPETNTLMREGVESIINPFDEFAIEMALRQKDLHGANVTALSMGPAQAEAALREALARGADDAVLISGREFAGSDTWATSYALACAIKRLAAPPDLVLFGKQAIDGDTAQVGPGVSAFLDLPLATSVVSLQITGGGFVVERAVDHGTDLVEGPLPAVITVSKGSAAPRFASLEGWLRASAAPITHWGAADIGTDPAKTGLDGSPTRVRRIFAPPARSGGRRIDARENSGEAVAAVLGEIRKIRRTQ